MSDKAEARSAEQVYVKTFFHRDDYERIVERATREGRPVANWLRQTALTALSQPVPVNPGLPREARTVVASETDAR